MHVYIPRLFLGNFPKVSKFYIAIEVQNFRENYLGFIEKLVNKLKSSKKKKEKKNVDRI